MSREQIIRDTAYAIWEAEGKPEGRHAQHWTQAEERVAASTAPSPNGAAKTKAASGKSSVKGAAVKSAAAKSAAAKSAQPDAALTAPAKAAGRNAAAKSVKTRT